MVGDRRHDIEGAVANGVTSVGVAWGFAADGELQAAGADHVVTSVAELGRLLTGAPTGGLSVAANDARAGARN